MREKRSSEALHHSGRRALRPLRQVDDAAYCRRDYGLHEQHLEHEP
jgi:hypothetical protein